MASSFLDMLNQANVIVTGDYPGATFLEASLNIEMAGSPWNFVFNDPGTVPNSTVILTNYMGNFQLPPKYYNAPWGGDRAIKLPIPMGLEEAEYLAKNAGYTGNIVNITLRWPLAAVSPEPTYIFGIPSQGVHVFVGIYSHKVTTSPITIEEPQEATAE